MPAPAPRKLDDALAREIAERHPPDLDYLVAISGGRDSVALLNFLLAHGYERLVVVHVNHRLRGEESEADAAFVARLASAAGVPCEIRPVDVATEAERSRLSLETAARDLRYRALAEVAKTHGIPRVLLGHHAGDQVETILINFFRGSGPRGLAGMEPVSRRAIDGVDVELLRPFLEVERGEIDAYLAERGLDYREDASNAEDFALRNRIRSDLLPTLQEVFGREVGGAVLRSAELMRRLEEWAEQEKGDRPIREDGPGPVGLDVAALRKMPTGRRDRILLEWLRDSGVPDCGFAEVETAASVLLSDDTPAKANLPGDRHVRRRQGLLFLE